MSIDEPSFATAEAHLDGFDDLGPTTTILPCWAMVEVVGGLGRLWGWITPTKVGGADFVAIEHPKGRVRRLVNAGLVKSITPCDEEAAREHAAAQWRATWPQ